MSIYYQDDYVTLHHGDAESVISDHLETGLAQITITSPPYNMGLTPGGNGRGMYRPGGNNKGGRFRDGYGQFNDALPQDEYDAWQRRILALLWASTPEDGAIFYNHKQRIEHGKVRVPLGLDFGIPLRQIITWDRGTGIGVNKRHYCSVSEWVFLFAKPDFSLKNHSASGAGDVWRLGMALDDHGHPAPFPPGLPQKIIETTAAASVLDPFAGSGTTLRAAKDAGIKSVGIELNEKYCEIIARRCAQEVLDFGSAS
ncbi:site-specific DNA-methyltransferase [Rhodococcus sp. DSM 6344]|nr:site-specific DNA-methyltransferase [Rhodococcus erythropolis]